MTITFLDIYNKITGQAWSMFDSEVEDKEEFETNVTTSIQKALSALWCSFNFVFREKSYTLKTVAGKSEYNRPRGNIIKKTVGGRNVYSMKYGKKFLPYERDYEILEDKTGEPESFALLNDKICIYPTPDAAYDIKVDYLTFEAACNADGDTKFNLEEDDDYINISEDYEDLFEKCLMPLAMTYLIASDTDENFSQYHKQYETAYKNLIDFCRGADIDKTIGWKRR